MPQSNRNPALLLSACLVLASLVCLPQAVSAQTYPTVTLTAYRVQEIDPIDLIGGDWDWYYYIGTFDGVWDWYGPYDAPNGVEVIINGVHPFTSTTTSFEFSVVFCEGDTFSLDDRADISSDLVGGSDDVADCIPGTGVPPNGAFHATWNLVTETLSGDTTTVEMDYYRTSGDYDGSTGSDQNDANFWFNITDNYGLPFADAGPDKQGYIGDTISFDGGGSGASPGSSIEFYEWDYDSDGSYDATGKIVSTTFSAKGSHTVTLRVTDSIGVTDTDTTTVEILNKDPIAAFAFSPADPNTSDEIEFSDASTDPDGTIASWSWDFGDGGTSTTKNPTHSYADDGDYVVVLNITDNDGGTDEATQTVTVDNVGPAAGFSISPGKPTTADDMQFTDTSTDSDGSCVEWEWKFGDGYTSALRNPTHKYSDVGTYTIELTVTDDDGDTDTATLTLTVDKAGPPPLVDFSDPMVILAILIIIIIIMVALFAFWRSRTKDELE
ncbi:MAG: PKD domain-containing protein [Thermoplasmata archaeon]